MKAKTQTGSEPVVKRGRPACDDCKAKKKRCPHRQEVGEEISAGAGAQTRRRKRDEDGAQDPNSNQPKAGSEGSETATPTPAPATTTTPAAPPAAITAAPSTSLDEVEKPGAKRVMRERPSKPVIKVTGPKKGAVTTAKPNSAAAVTKPKRNKHDFPTTSVDGAAAMSVHSVFSRDLEKRLEEFDAKFKAAQQALQEALLAGQAVKETVASWKAAWAAGQ
ncbi:uncharacterized protein N7459_002967 [Penicillium hispanicum]|uniref:uncharacterized protein n=1 Tax=Penicillium hispanicum TaxID=1080232 RepID=UPI002540B10D|nr:uncharacterized protein N7459_002967 [Penicillium hispanicum]KAJ5587202.1 hypothetical protein N7459_002967 [Penicillium hispanicum]